MSAYGSRDRVTGWVGWIWFAAIMLIMVGFFNIIDGLVALLKHDVYGVTNHGLIVFNYTAWGWIMLIIGVIQLIVGIALLSGAFWARLATIFICVISAISHIAFITAYPLWSIIVITVNIDVLWDLEHDGCEVQDALHARGYQTVTHPLGSGWRGGCSWPG